MPTPPYAAVKISVNGGALTSGGLTVSNGDTLALSAESTVGWKMSPAPEWRLYGHYSDYTVPAGWSTKSVTQADGSTITVFYYLGTTPPVITVQGSGWWGKVNIGLYVDGGGGALTDEGSGFQVVSPGGQYDISHREGVQWGGGVKWIQAYRDNIRAMEPILVSGSVGPTGFSPAWLYAFDTATAEADPGAGDIRFDNATLASVTKLFISETTDAAADISAQLATWDDSTNTAHRGTITVQSESDFADFAVFSVTGAITDNGGWITIPVSPAGVGTLPTNGDAVRVSFTRTGNVGAAGATGAAGYASAWAYVFDTATAANDPGSGGVRFNNATPASVDEIYLSETTDEAQAIAAQIATWDDSTTTGNRGALIFQSEADPASFLVCTIRGALTDHGAWVTIPVTANAVGTLPANAAAMRVTFIRTGDIGATGATGPAGPTSYVVDKPTVDGAATNTLTARAIYINDTGATRTLTAVSAWFVTTVALNATNYASVDFSVVDAAGVVGTVTSITSAAADFTARIARTTGSLSISVVAGGSVMVAVSKPGTGVTTPVGTFQVTIT